MPCQAYQMGLSEVDSLKPQRPEPMVVFAAASSVPDKPQGEQLRARTRDPDRQ
jgi:hypothetical protein